MALATPTCLFLLNLLGSLLVATAFAAATATELSKIATLTVFSGESVVVSLPPSARVRADEHVVYELHALAGVVLAPIAHGKLSEADLARGQATLLLPASDKAQGFLLRVLKMHPGRTPPEILVEYRLNSLPRLVPSLLTEMTRAGITLVRVETAPGLTSIAPLLRTVSEIPGGSDPLLIWDETPAAEGDPGAHYDNSITIRFSTAPDQVRPSISGEGTTWILDCPRDWPARLATDPSVDQALATELRALWRRTFPESPTSSQP